MRAAPLFGSDTLPRVLSLVTAVADQTITAREVSRRLGTNLESTQRAMHRLADTGLVQPLRKGRELKFVVDRSDMVGFQELRAISHRIAGMGEDLRNLAANLPTGTLDQAFVFGSIASGRDRPDSDVDIFIVGTAHAHDLADFTWKWSQVLGRDVVPIIRTPRGIDAGLREGSSFVRNVLSGPKLMLLGSTDDLPKVA